NRLSNRKTKMSTVKAVKQIRVAHSRTRNVDSTLSIKDEELLAFTESCRDLFEAGLPINEILCRLQTSTRNREFASAIESMVEDIENGKLLSEATARFPKVFGEDYRSLIEAAEKSGRWTRSRDRFGERQDGILEMLIRYIKRRKSTRERVKSGLVYPAMIATPVIAALCAFAFYILRALRQLFDQIGAKEDVWILTRIMFAFCDLAERYWWVMPTAIALIGYWLMRFWKYGRGRELWMKYQLRLKGIGPVFVRLHLGETMLLRGTLFAAGRTPQELLD